MHQDCQEKKGLQPLSNDPILTLSDSLRSAVFASSSMEFDHVTSSHM